MSPKNIGRVSRFQLDTVDPAHIDEYLSRKATFAVTVKVRYAEPVSQIWAAFISEDAFTWMPTVKGAPYRDAGQSVGAGSRRLIVSSLLVGQEQYEIFVPAERLAFNISSASLPGLKSLVEDYRFSSTTTGGTELVWTVGLTPKFVGFLPLRLLAPLARPLLRLGMRGLGPLSSRRG